MHKRQTAAFYILLSIFIFALAGPIIKITVSTLPPFIFLSYRYFIASLLAIFYFIFINPNFFRKLNSRNLIKLTFYSLFSSTLALSFGFWGLSKSTVLELGLIGSIGPLLVTFGGALFLHEKIYNNEKKGMFLAFTGTLITIFAPVLLNKENIVFAGNILFVLGIVSDSIGILIGKKLTAKTFKPLDMVFYSSLVAAVTIIPLTIYLHGFDNSIQTITSAGLVHHLNVLYIAIVSGLLGYLFFLKGQKLIEAGEASLYFYLSPVLTFPLAIFWLGEKITMPFIVGAVFITLGVFVAEYRKKG